MKERFFRFFVVVCAVSLICSVAAPSQAAESVVRLKYANMNPPTHPLAQLSDEWCKEVEKRSNGRVKVAFFPAGTLVSAAQTYDGVVKGIVDIGFSLMSYTPGRMPLSEALVLPLGFKNSAQATRAADALFRKFRPKEFDDTKVFYLHALGGGTFHTKTPVNKMEDLKGLRIKGDGYTAKIIAAAGGTPTTMSMMETYDALKRGLAEGALTPMETLTAWKFGEICKYTYINEGAFYANGFFIAMNKEKWNSLPKDIQQIIDKMNEEWFEKEAKVWKEIDASAFEIMTKAGHKFTIAGPDEVAKMKEKMRPMIDNYIKEMKTKGLPGEEAVKFLQDYVKTAPTD
jgi:TRAP-type transport system periplasmic protein